LTERGKQIFLKAGLVKNKLKIKVKTKNYIKGQSKDCLQQLTSQVLSISKELNVEAHVKTICE
jgi:hypothetical protein